MTAWLSRAPTVLFTAYAMFAGFATYLCVYGFRKAFTAAEFAGTMDLQGLPPVDIKIAFVIAQVLGYASSKFLGIKIVSEMPAHRRALAIGGCVGLAWASLVVFAFLPPRASLVAFFVNGLSLGWIWGLVYSFLEGRRVSDVLGAGLCASFIVSSGVVKAVGRILLDAGVSEAWMPALTGALFLAPTGVSLWLLSQLPPPTPADEAERTRRAPMDGPARSTFFWTYAPGLVPLVVLYILLAAYRDFRDNFAVELWSALGYGDQPQILATAELPVAGAALVAVGLVMWVRDNRYALLVIHAMMAVGTLAIGVATFAFQSGWIGPAPWMITVGAGLYIAYVPYNCVLFDRLVAAVGVVGTAAFLIYVADSLGYAGAVVVMLYKTFGQADLSWVDFFVTLGYVSAAACTALYLVSALYFAARIPAPAAHKVEATARH